MSLTNPTYNTKLDRESRLSTYVCIGIDYFFIQNLHTYTLSYTYCTLEKDK